MTAIEFKNVKKNFANTEVIRGVDLQIDDGEFIVFVGPSGCGKSTLLRIIAGLEDISEGELFMRGERVNEKPPAARGIAMVFQSYALYPHMSVWKNLAFGLRRARGVDIAARVKKAAEMLQIVPLLSRLPRQLSGGQRQRVAIGRAIVRDPRVFLFDEPLSNLDASLRGQTRVEIAALHRRLGTTMIYVTHDQVEAMTLADRIVVLNRGLIEQVGTPRELYHHPQNIFVAGFIGAPQMNLLTVRRPAAGMAADNGDAQVLLADFTVQTAVSAKTADTAAGTLTLGLRPEHTVVADDGGGQVRGEVSAVEEMGESHLIHAELSDGQKVVARESGDPRVTEGDTVGFNFPPARCHLFDGSGRACKNTT